MTVRGTAVLGAVLLAVACDTPCAFRILTRLEPGGRSVACCGAADSQDVAIPDEPDLAIDLAQVAVPDRAGGQDLWLTRTDCDRLFDQPYAEPGTGPRPTPRCEVLLGPVAPGRVSPRVALTPGRYRIFAQAYATNTTVNDYRLAIGVWGSDCGGSPARP